MNSMKKRIKQGLLILLAVAVSFTMAPFIPGSGTAEAAGTIGKLGNTTYTSFEKLTDDLKSNYKSKNVTIEMTNNWNAAGSSDFDRRLVIPSGCTATLNMHGFVFNRNNAYDNDSKSDGELIYLDSGSSLIINGSTAEPTERNKEHPQVAVYTSTSKSAKATGRITTHGGTLTGGCNTYGAGGIHVKSNCTLTLNHVTIAGCSSRDGTVWNGFGGGIYVKSDYSTIRLNNSLITGCYADTDGGAIYTNEDPTTVELNDTMIQKNYAYSDGGGMYLCDERTHVTGSNGASITENVCGKKGGGIFTNDNDISVTGLVISGNKSTDGAGIYSDDEKNSFSGLVLKNNQASERGGGIYVNGQENSISSSTITENKAGISGGGVYVGSNIGKKFSVTGKVIVRDNKGRNFYMSDSSPEDNRVNFNLTKDSDVHFGYYNLDGKNKIMVTQDGKEYKSPNCIQFLTAENNGCSLAFDPAPDGRKIYYIRGDIPSGLKPAPKAQDPTDVYSNNINDASHRDRTSDRTAGKVGTVGKGGNGVGNYDLIRGFSLHEETDSDFYDSAVAFYYSDAFFDDDPKNYNPHLATTSLVMAYAGMYLRATQPTDKSGNYYYNRHAAARQFMADIGCPDQRIYVNDSNEKKPGTDTIGVTIASKDLALYVEGGTKKKTLIPIVVRGGGYEQEWASNATLGNAWEMTNNGKDAEAKGFSNAADQVEAEIDKYIRDYGLRDEIAAGDVIFWISGYSRAGATSNLTAKRLVEKYADGSNGKNNKVFAYTCEAPMGGTDKGEHLKDKSKYYCIHNIVNAVDVVPQVAPQLMGFKRYGVDHYVPGTESGLVAEENVFASSAFVNGDRRKRGGLGGPNDLTTRRDNQWLKAKGGAASGEIPGDMKKKMLVQLRAVDSGIVFDDYFHPMAMNFFPGVSMYENGDYWGNDVEPFVADFLRFAQEGRFPQMNPSWTQAISDRDMFNSQIQTALRETLALVFTMDAEQSGGFIGRASSIMDKINTVGGDLSMLEVYEKIIGSWHDRTDLEKRHYTTLLWKKLEDTGAFDYLSESDISELENNWPALADFIFRLVDGDYSYEPGSSSYSRGWAKGMDKTMTLIPTFATYATYILQNHYPEVNLAWARVYDSYYDDETTEYMVRASTQILPKPPSANGQGTVRTTDSRGNIISQQEDGTLVPGADRINKVIGDQRIVLEQEDIVGEAIYYDLVDTTKASSPVEIENNRLYRGGIDLHVEDGEQKSYTLTTYDISYNKRSASAVYNITVLDDRHNVEVYPSGSQQGQEPQVYQYREGDQVTVTAQVPDESFFSSWSVQVLDRGGTAIGDDAADALMGMEEVQKATATFTMPKSGDKIRPDSGAKYPDGYKLIITANYKKKIEKIRIDTNSWAPVTGGDHTFATKANLTFDDGSPVMKDQPVVWSYLDSNGKPVIVPEGATKAYDNTVYILTTVAPQDAAHAYASSLTGEYKTWPNDEGRVDDITVTKNEADGSAVIRVKFIPTESSDTPHPQPTTTSLSVGNRDLLTDQYTVTPAREVFQVQTGFTVTLTAPNAVNYVFKGWEINNETGLKLTADSDPQSRTIKVIVPATGDYEPIIGGKADIDALFAPVVTEAAAAVDQPAGGQPLAGTKQLVLTLSDGIYDIHPDCIELIWYPEISEGEKAEYLTAYTATVSIKANKEGKVLAREVDQDLQPIGSDDYIDLTDKFAFADHIKGFINGKKATVDDDRGTLAYIFPITKYTFDCIEQPADVAGVNHASSDADIKKLTPKTATIVTKEGKRMVVELDPNKWTINEIVGGDDSRKARVLMVSQSVNLPEGVANPTDRQHEVNLRVDVEEADTARSPDASLDSGEYLEDQVAVLTTNEKGGTTYYTTDGSDPTNENGTRKTYKGETIFISRDSQDLVDKNTFVLRAYTVNKGMWDSPEVFYAYTFVEGVPVPDDQELVYNGEDQAGIDSREYFEVVSVPEGASLNEDGDVVATDAGTYKTVLKIKTGYKWITDEKAKETTTDDQTVSVTIHPADISEVAEVTTKGNFKTIEDLKAALKVSAIDDRELAEGRDYRISYTDGQDGKATVTVEGIGNYTGSIVSTFIIGEKDRKTFTITLDLNGGELDGLTGVIFEECYEDTVYKLPKPSRDGYKFDYWKGSRYEAGEKYKVKENHTFVAQWQKTEDAAGSSSRDSSGSSGDDSSESSGGASDSDTRTGDEMNLFMWLALLTISLLGLLSIAIAMRKAYK